VVVAITMLTYMRSAQQFYPLPNSSETVWERLPDPRIDQNARQPSQRRGACGHTERCGNRLFQLPCSLQEPTRLPPTNTASSILCDWPSQFVA
jgi:hypothetical protein